MKSKLQDEHILDFLLQFDLVWISEVKVISQTSVPGFIMYYNKSKYGQNRGGMILLVKCALEKFIIKVNVDNESMIFLELSLCAGVQLGGVYVPPADSPYFEPLLFGVINAVCSMNEKVIIFGDFNARVGIPQVTMSHEMTLEYVGIKDITVNPHGRELLNICNDNNMVVANHLRCGEKTFGGDLSFKRGGAWISEIDICILKTECIPLIKELKVVQNITGSDHAPLCITLSDCCVRRMPVQMLTERSNDLGMSYHRSVHQSLLRSPKYDTIDLDKFVDRLSNTIPPVISNLNPAGSEALDNRLSAGCGEVARVARECRLRVPRTTSPGSRAGAHSRWQRLLDTNDSALIWKSINWKGSISDADKTQPNNDQFRAHFEALLNPQHVDNVDEGVDIDSAPYIPVLDDPLTASELDNAMKLTKTNKSFVGLCPGLVRMLPITWFLFILGIFNIVFQQMCYPMLWCSNRLFVLFKSGDKYDCGNYREISIMDTLAKMYDLLLLNRLKLWARIDKCQAGGQQGRGCLEQIMALRLLCGYAQHKKEKLYVCFIDFCKAYDKVPRHKLIEVLKSIGCGKIMLYAIKNMYMCTKNLLHSTMINATVGVRQGAPSSCLLFTIYMDQMVGMLRHEVGEDGYLGTLHAFLLMDDTIIVATSRQKCIEKINVVLRYCEEYGMVLNSEKTKFMVIRSNNTDRSPLVINDFSIGYTHKYKYLGAWFSDDNKTDTVMKLHESQCNAAVNKFAVFCESNTDMPFVLKRQVLNAAVSAALLYSTESWFTNNPKRLVSQYKKIVKCALGVRNNTSVNLALIELGQDTVIDIIRKRRITFLKSKLAAPDEEEPFYYVYQLCREANTPGFRFLVNVINNEQGVASGLDEIREIVLNKPNDASKYVTYRTQLNPSLSSHPINYIPVKHTFLIICGRLLLE